MSEDFEKFIRQRLTPAQRQLFRSVVHGMTGRMNGEDIVDFLVGTFDGGPRLFILTTYQLWWIEPNNPVAWRMPGSQLDRMEPVGRDAIDVHLFPDPPRIEVPEVVRICDVDLEQAREFLAKVFMLSAGGLFGRPEAYWKSVEELHRVTKENSRRGCLSLLFAFVLPCVSLTCLALRWT